MTSPTAIQNRVISASAGSGKTYQLSNRYLALLFCGIPAERIIALTFTRKAADEIVNRIILRLAAAAQSPEQAQKLQTALTFVPADTVTPQSALNTLKHLLNKLPLLRIETFDSFFIRTIRAFAWEFGVNRDFEIIDGYRDLMAKEDVLRHILLSNLVEEDVKKDFFQNFKQATFGQEEKSVREKLHQFINESYQTYLQAPEGHLWGNLRSIWPNGSEWFFGDDSFAPEEIEAFFDDLDERYASFSRIRQYLNSWGKFFHNVHNYQPGARFSEHTDRHWQELIDHRPELEKNEIRLTYYNKEITLGPTQCGLLLRVMRHIIRPTLAIQTEKTRGKFQLLHLYDQVYGQQVRRAGKLNFADILHVITQAPALSASSPQADRLYINYRLDATFDHWLLDEFQDTSTAQWQALRNIVEEILQDPSGQRSFFYVGDVKQSIYGWRGGDPRLFDHIAATYSLPKELLAKSWRSSPEVLNTVNEVFNNLGTKTSLPPAVITRWEQNWSQHYAAAPCQNLSGYATVYNLRREEDFTLNKQNRYAFTTDLIQELPTDLSIAVLVRNNDAGRAMVDCLRQKGLEATWEGDANICDNPLVTAFLSLIKLAEHPSDRFAQQHLRMTPLNECLVKEGVHHDELPLVVINELHEYGYEYFIRYWLKKLEIGGYYRDPFTNIRAAQLLQAAQEYDRLNLKNTSGFIDYVKSYKVSEGEAGNTIRVMTIHKAKGLEFDAVFLPDLQHSSITSCGYIGTTISQKSVEDATASWVLEFPPKEIAAADKVLASHMKNLELDNAYEELCLLYVAMTRAKRALYLICTELAEQSEAIFLATIIKQTINNEHNKISVNNLQAIQTYQHGDPDWAKKPISELQAETTKEIPNLVITGEHPPIIATPPLYQTDNPIPAQHYFLAQPNGLVTKTIRSCLNRIAWLDAEGTESLVSKVLATEKIFTPIFVEKEVQPLLTKLLAQEEIATIFRRQDKPTILWRGRTYELIVGNSWYSGTLDRVTIELDAEEKPIAATVYFWLDGATARQSVLPLTNLANILSVAPQNMQVKYLDLVSGALLS